ncbi:MAG: hypothetical protein QNJ11_17805 [Woeseiaceae bacterium]|nr:hypothetical protein [Woeseiaceae bacterium]
MRDAFRRLPPDLERENPTHGKSRESKRIGSVLEHALCHIAEVIVLRRVGDESRYGERVDLRLPQSLVAHQSGQQDEVGG